MQSQNIVHIYLTLCPIQLHGTVFSISTTCLRIFIFPLKTIQHNQCSQFQKQAWGRKKQCQDSGILFEMLQQQCFPITSVESSHVKKRALRLSVVHSPFLPPGLHITVSALRNRTQKQPHGVELQPSSPFQTGQLYLIQCRKSLCSIILNPYSKIQELYNSTCTTTNKMLYVARGKAGNKEEKQRRKGQDRGHEGEMSRLTQEQE